MAMQSPFFGKRESDALNLRPASGASLTGTPLNTTHQNASPAEREKASAANPTTVSGTAPESGSKLTVGPNIKLKGVEITDCDTLVVEGFVEATMDSRVIQIAEVGSFKGSADIDIAEIRGTFDGHLTVRQTLTIHATGKVTGKIRYGRIVIEEGGQLSGEIGFGASPGGQPARAAPTAASWPSTRPRASSSGRRGWGPASAPGRSPTRSRASST